MRALTLGAAHLATVRRPGSAALTPFFQSMDRAESGAFCATLPCSGGIERTPARNGGSGCCQLSDQRVAAL